MSGAFVSGSQAASLIRLTQYKELTEKMHARLQSPACAYHLVHTVQCRVSKSAVA